MKKFLISILAFASLTLSICYTENIFYSSDGKISFIGDKSVRYGADGKIRSIK